MDDCSSTQSPGDNNVRDSGRVIELRFTTFPISVEAHVAFAFGLFADGIVCKILLRNAGLPYLLAVWLATLKNKQFEKREMSNGGVNLLVEWGNDRRLPMLG